MDIIVCIKQVPDTDNVEIDEEEGTLVREGVPSIINPEDKNGLEAALQLKEKYGGTVTAMSMGPLQAKRALKEALAMGVDEAVLLSDEEFAGSDTLATAYTLAQGIKKVGYFDVIICGRQAIDGDTAQVGPQIAENLNLPQVTYASEINVEDKQIKIKRKMSDGYSIIATQLPVLVTVVEEINQPRYPGMSGIVDAHQEQEVKVWGAEELEIDVIQLGLDGSPTQVYETFVPTHEQKGEFLTGTPEEQADKLVTRLKEEKLV